MTSGTAKFGEEAKQEILDKPDSSHSSIMEDGSNLHLNQAAGVVEVDSDSSTHAISVADVEPKDTVKFNSSVVSNRFVKACRALDVDIQPVIAASETSLSTWISELRVKSACL